MSSIDRRIVEMQFNNQGFEKGVHTTLGSLQKLNDGLKLKGASNGLNDVSKGISKLNSSGFGVLSQGVSSITSQFSALGVMGVTALANITNSAVNTGKRLAKALTIDPIMTGFSEYELKMNSISTILANTADEGATIEDVNKALNELNEYSDQTIYNFAQMTDNIGKFTAAGVNLEDSVAAIKGMSNLAAYFGVDNTRAAGAMYQMSQALAAGKVQLMDWRSLINAGMSGEAFQKALIRTAEVMGTGAEAMIKKYGSFNESLTKGEWLTADVMLETLKQISGAYKESELRAKGYSATEAKAIVTMAKRANQAATEVRTVTGMLDAMKEAVQSGWAISWEHILGDKEEATELLTSVKNAFEAILEPSTTARNKMLEFWNEAGGRDDVIKGLSNIFGGLGKGLGSIGQAFRDVFPAMTGKRLVELSEGFKNLSEKFKMSDSTAKKIKDTFKGLFSVLKIGVDAVKGLLKGLSPMVDILLGVGKGFVTVTGFIGDFVSKIAGAVSSTNIFTKIGEGISKTFGSVGKVLNGIGDSFGNFISGLSFDSFGKAFETIGKGLSVLGEGFNGLLKGIGDAIGTIDFGVIMKGINALLGAGILKGIKSIVDSFKDVGESFNIFEKIGSIRDNVSEILDTVKSSLESYQNSLNASTLTKIATAIGVLAGSLLLLASIKPENMQTALTGITVIFAELVGAMAILLKLMDDDKLKLKLKNVFTLTTTMIGISSAILILSAALKNISGLDLGQLCIGLLGVAGLLTMMTLVIKNMKSEEGHLLRIAMSLTVFATSLNILAKAVKSLGALKPETLYKGLISIGVLLAELSFFMESIDDLSGVRGAAGLLALAGALNVLALAVRLLGNMDTENLVKGLASVGIVLAEIGIFSEMMKDNTGILKTSIGLTVMAGALMGLSVAVKMFGSMKLETIGTGIFAIAAALVLLDIAVTTMSDSEMSKVALGVAAMGASLLILNKALTAFGSMSGEEIAKSLVVLAGSLIILSIAMDSMIDGLAGATAMLVMAAALAIFTPQLIALSTLDPVGLAIGLLAIGGAMAVVGVAATALTPALPATLGLAAAMGLLGIACLGVGAGLLAFGTGLSLVAASGGAAMLVLINGIKGLISLLPQLGLNLGLMVVNILQALSQNLPTIITAIGTLITGVLEAFTVAIPQIANAAVELIITLANTIAANAGRLAQAGIDLAVSLINGLADGIRDNTKAIASAIDNLGSAIVELLYNMLPDWTKAGIDWISGLVDGMGQKIGAAENQGGKAADAARNGAKSREGEFRPVGAGLVDRLIAGITGQNGAASTAGGKAADAARNGANSKSGSFQPIGAGFVNKLIGGIRSMFGGATSAGSGAASAAKSGAQSGASGFSSIGSSMISGLISGIRSMASSVASTARSVVQGAVNAAKSALKINSPSKVFIGIGKYTGEGFIKGLDSYAGKVKNSTSDLANTAIEAMTNPLAKVSNLLSDDIDANPVIRPVLDLSDVKNGSRTIGSLLGQNGAVSLSANSSGAISRTIGNIQNGNDNSDILHALKDLKDGLSNTGNTSYTINGITYDDGSNVSNAVETLVRAARIERRI